MPELRWPAPVPAGTRIGVAISGGGDSVALLHLLHREIARTGWLLTVLHVEHGLRGAESRADAAFVRELAQNLEVTCEVRSASTAETAGTRGRGLEEAGRALRYGWFRELLAGQMLDVIVTGHTLDDQSETVLGKLLRGAWTEGLSGIHPLVPASDLPGASSEPLPPGSRGKLLRPLLWTRREDLRQWLVEEKLPWREDASNADPAFTRNRLRAEALPLLRTFQPRIAEQLAQVATLAREEEAYWQSELRKVLPGLLLPGRPVRGGGRAATGEQTLAIEVERLRPLPQPLQRRVLRAAAKQLGTALDWEETERLLTLAQGPAGGSAPRREQLAATLRAERTPRELRLVCVAEAEETPASEHIPIPGVSSGAFYGLRLQVEWSGAAADVADSAILRAALPGDRVELRYSSGGPKRIKEVLERMTIAPPDRKHWPVLEWQGEIVWLRGAVLQPTPRNRLLRVNELPTDN